MEIIWIKKTASQEEQDQIVKSLDACEELSGTMTCTIHRVKVCPVNPTNVVPDTNGDYVLLGLRNEIDPKLKMQLPRR